MKKLFLLSFCLFWGVMNVCSQSSGMTAKELKFRNSIEQFLKEEGYVPTIDDDDNSLNFKREGNRYWLTVEGDNPYYIRLHIGGFSAEDVNKKLILEACNYANYNKRCGKACYSDDGVYFTVEYYCQTIEGFKNSFYDNIRAADTVKKETSDYYNEHDK